MSASRRLLQRLEWLRFLLLLAGDIERNPGPARAPNTYPRHPWRIRLMAKLLERPLAAAPMVTRESRRATARGDWGRFATDFTQLLKTRASLTLICPGLAKAYRNSSLNRSDWQSSAIHSGSSNQSRGGYGLQSAPQLGAKREASMSSSLAVSSRASGDIRGNFLREAARDPEAIRHVSPKG